MAIQQIGKETQSQMPDEYKRRYEELNRRLGVLNYRKERLTNELQAINIAVVSLNEQMRRDIKYQQLTIENNIYR